MTVVNGDGLVNSFSYYKMITKKRLDLFLDYLNENNIKYYLTNGAFNHCLGNPYIQNNCEILKNNSEITSSIEKINGSYFEIINGKEILKSNSRRKFMRFKLFKYPDSIFNQL